MTLEHNCKTGSNFPLAGKKYSILNIGCKRSHGKCKTGIVLQIVKIEKRRWLVILVIWRTIYLTATC